MYMYIHAAHTCLHNCVHIHIRCYTATCVFITEARARATYTESCFVLSKVLLGFFSEKYYLAISMFVYHECVCKHVVGNSSVPA